MHADFNEELSNLREDHKREFCESMFKAYRAKSVEDEENSVVKGRVWTRLNGGTSFKTDTIMDSGCTYPVTTKTVTDEMKDEIKPLKESLTIYEPSGKSLEVLGTEKMFLEAEVLGGRKLVEAVVMEGEGSKETLISLDLLNKWDLIHASFPHETISDYFNKMNKKRYQAYTGLYNFQSHIYNESKPMREPRKNAKS